MLSVVIPTKDRRETLLETLAVLARQDPPAGGLEVIVADNGSRDGTEAAVDRLAGDFPHSLRLLVERTPGPASARNAGVSAARGDVVLFLGDDTAPADPGMLAEHARLHAENGPEGALLGRVTWDRAAEVTLLMDWLERGGIQFKFNALEPGPVPASRAFCTAHVSLKRELVERVGGFDGRFPDAAMEDVEIGGRLERAGIRLEYRPRLLALHSHPTTLEGSLRRLHRVGRAAALLHRISPHQGDEVVGRPRGWKWTLLGLTPPLWSLLARDRSPRRVREMAWRALHMRAFAEGYELGPPGSDAAT